MVPLSRVTAVAPDTSLRCMTRVSRWSASSLVGRPDWPARMMAWLSWAIWVAELLMSSTEAFICSRVLEYSDEKFSTDRFSDVETVWPCARTAVRAAESPGLLDRSCQVLQNFDS